MEASVATLLLVTAAVVLACVVVDYAVGVAEGVLNNHDIPQLDRIKALEDNLLNQTNLFNATQPQLPSQP
jgi:hypothetical protein